jgi:outer membrane protein assembly factor BamB
MNVCATLLIALVLSSILLPCDGADTDVPDMGDITVGLLLFRDDGYYRWIDVPMGANNTALCATIAGCAAVGVPLNYSMSLYGAFVTSIFGTSAPTDFSWWWELLLWNTTSNSWQEAPMGASDLRLAPWDCIAWCPNSSAPPLPDPMTKYPWPKFRGDLANTGASLSIRNMTYINSDMSFGNGPIDCSVAIAHGLMFVSTGGVYNWSRMAYEKPPHLYALDAGGTVWQRETTAAGWQISSPAIGANAVVIGTSDGKVLAFSIADGTPLWNFSTGASATGVTSSPSIFRGTVYVPSGDGQLYALSLDGKLLWNLSLGGPAYMSSPAISDGRLMVGSDAGVLTCAALNGTLIWNYSVEGKVRTSPAVSDGRVYFIDTVYEGFTAIRSTLFALSVSDGSQIWNMTIPPSTSSPAVAGGRILFGTNTGVFAYDLSGARLWSHPTAGPVQSSPAVAGDRLYFTENSANGTMRVLSANEGREIWNFTPKPAQYLLCSPAITDAWLAFGSDNGAFYTGHNSSSPSLRVASWDIPKQLRAGSTVVVKVTIENRGDAVAKNVSIVLRDNDSPVGRPFNVSYLAPGKAVVATFRWTPGSGKHELRAIMSSAVGVHDVSRKEIQVPQAELISPIVTVVIIMMTLALILIIICMRMIGPGRKKVRGDEKK